MIEKKQAKKIETSDKNAEASLNDAGNKQATNQKPQEKEDEQITIGNEVHQDLKYQALKLNFKSEASMMGKAPLNLFCSISQNFSSSFSSNEFKTCKFVFLYFRGESF